MTRRKPALAKNDTAVPSRKKKNAFNLPDDLLERARDVAYWDRLALSELIREGLKREIGRRARQRGSKYPPRESQLKVGRPIS
jgi:hypothetical protein